MRRSALKETILRSSWIAEVRGVVLFALLVGLSASALLLFIGPARAVAAPRSRPGKIAYKVVVLEEAECVLTPQWKEAMRRAEGDPWRATPVFEEMVLNSWSEKGWELVQVVRRSPKSTLLYMRRGG
jgi:hypothetical protein